MEMNMKMRRKEQKNFYSSVNWLYKLDDDLSTLPKTVDKLADWLCLFDDIPIVELERKYERRILWKRVMKKLFGFFVALVPRSEFNGRYKK